MAVGLIDGSSGDPSQGLQLRQALTYYGAYPELENARGEKLLHIYQRLRAKQQCPHIFGGALTEEERKELASLELIFAERLVAMLRAGTLEAKGRLANAPSINREIIPADFWRLVQLSTDDNTATADDITVTSLLIFEKTPPAGIPAAKAQVAPSFSEAAVRDWYLQRVKGYPADETSSGKLDEEDAKAHFGKAISRHFLRQLRAQHAPDHWKKSGPKSD